MEEPLPLTTFHTEKEEHLLSGKSTPTPIKREVHLAVLGHHNELNGEEAACNRYALTAPHIILFVLKTPVVYVLREVFIGDLGHILGLHN